MSKRILLVVLVLGAIGASNAYASRARDLVLGTGDAGVVLGTGGSSGTFYTDDAYNMFYNPAYVNDYKNWAIIEKSNYSQGATGTTTGTTAQGGFVTGLGNFNLGVFLNRQDGLQDAVYTYQGRMRPIDVLLGGDWNAIKWGVGFSYAAATSADPNNSANTTTARDYVVKAGAEYMDFDPFVQWRFSGADNSIGTTPNNKMLELGARYHWGEWTPFAVYKYTSYNSQTDYRAYGIGVGRTTKVADMAKLAYSIAYFRQAVGVQNVSSNSTAVSVPNNGSGTQGSRTVVPLNISVEGDPATWLTLRAGLGYNFMDNVNQTTVADNTFGRIGATIHASKLDFDFAVGQAAGTNPSNEGATDTNSQSFDISHQFFTAGSIQYHW